MLKQALQEKTLEWLDAMLYLMIKDEVDAQGKYREIADKLNGLSLFKQADIVEKIRAQEEQHRIDLSGVLATVKMERQVR